MPIEKFLKNKTLMNLLSEKETLCLIQMYNILLIISLTIIFYHRTRKFFIICKFICLIDLPFLIDYYDDRVGQMASLLSDHEYCCHSR